MADLLPTERLQPSLLDRLTDDSPEKNVESRDQRVFSTERLRSSVLRDLAWLLNTSNLSQSEDLTQYPEVARSVVNYGIPELAGACVSKFDLERLEAHIHQAVLDFEPRILADSVRVVAKLDDTEYSHNALRFEIHGDLWNQPLPLKLYVSTLLDLESGNVVVEEIN